MTYITYLGCDNSSLEFTLSNKKVLKAKTPAEISEILISYDKDSYMCSSSMDFAKEYGFKTNDGANYLSDRTNFQYKSFSFPDVYIPEKVKQIPLQVKTFVQEGLFTTPQTQLQLIWKDTVWKNQ